MNSNPNYSRRDFLGTTFAGAAAASVIGALESSAAQDAAPASAAPPVEIKRKIKLGVIGEGGRGSWITNLFQQHGGYEIYAVADYFPDRAKAAGDRFGVAESRRFSGLSGYKRLIESGVEAVAIESPPYFHPQQAAAAVEAGKHVYCAKPIAIDVPGCRTMESSGKKATDKKLVFLVDFQTRADPFYIEALRRVHAGDIGKIAFAEGIYHADCPWRSGMTRSARIPRSGNAAPRLGTRQGPVGRHHHGAEHPHAGCRELGYGHAAVERGRHLRTDGAAQGSARAPTISPATSSFPSTSASRSARGNSTATARGRRASASARSARRAYWKPNTAATC